MSPATGRIHCDYNIAAAKSGRFTSSHPNLQQLPAARAPEFRRCIIAAPGNVLICCDWNQVEMRAARWLSKDQALTRVYAEGRGPASGSAAAASVTWRGRYHGCGENPVDAVEQHPRALIGHAHVARGT